MRKQWIRAAKWLLALAGAALCVYLIRQTGWPKIEEALKSHWLFLLGMTVVYTAYHLLRTWTLQICIPQRTRFGHLFGIRLAGEAVAYIAVGSVLGDTLKVILGKDRIAVVPSATGVFAEKLIYHLSGAAFICGGLLAAVWKFGANPFLTWTIAGLTAGFAAVVTLMSSGFQPLARILSHVPVRRPALREALLKTEQSLSHFCREHPREFALALLLDLLSYFYSVAEVYAILWMLGRSPGFLDLWYYQAVVKAMNAAMMVVPANLGIFEATHVFLAGQLAYGREAGMVTALLIRIRATLWALFGYAWFVHLLHKPQASGAQNITETAE